MRIAWSVGPLGTTCYDFRVLLLDAPVTVREIITHEEVPLADVFREIGHLLIGREDAVLFGAQAVNVYAQAERMTQDVDVISTAAQALAEEMCARLATRFRIATRLRVVVPRAYRVYQVRKPQNRHLAHARQADSLPPFRVVEGLQVITPEELVAMKIISIAARRGRPKELSDRLDVKRLLLAIPDLKSLDGAITASLRRTGQPKAILDLWQEIVREPSLADEDEEGWSG